jgi:membrane protein implicated in regulation of membrane protease activity
MCPVMILFGAIFWCAVNAVPSVNWAVLIGLFIVYSVLYFLLARRFMMNTQERAATAGFFRKAWGRISGRG